MRQRLHEAIGRLWHPPERRPWTLTGALGLLWLVAWLDWSAWRLLPSWFDAVVFLSGAAVAGGWVRRFRHAPPVIRRIAMTAALPFLCQASVASARMLGLGALTAVLAQLSLALLFIVGLAWTVRLVERGTRARLATAAPARPAGPGAAVTAGAPTAPGSRIWDPLDLRAWFYRSRNRRLDQSGLAFVAYTVAFLLVVLVLTRLSGCREIYEMPAGGGEEKRLEQLVRIEKVVRRKYVINPFSAVRFNPPPIEDVPLQLREITSHRYQVGQGENATAGFSGGTDRGKVRFIRLEYEGGDWDQDFGIGSDLNMLLEYGIRTGHRVNDRTESRRIGQLARFPAHRSPPLVYLTGQRNLVVPDADIEVLREYLLDKHGMLFADNGGSAGWHGQFFELMRRVLPRVRPVRVPLDHPVHRLPYEIPFLPYVAPHGGKDAWGWVVDGRLVCYYHPGDIGDAWADGHAGVRREIWETCYQLGTNIIFYAHAQYNRWIETRIPDDERPTP